ncbi:MAG: hypothetical protein GXP50_00160, partial [Deltaproteobacteria bacterium]|nr:hypothetical protein [Deltaproteobacteria bacterium]
RIADAAARMPLDRDVRLGLTLLARALEIVAEMNVWQGPAPPDGRRILQLVEEALETLQDLAQGEDTRRAVQVALFVARRMGTALLLADPSDPDAVVAATRGLLQDLAPLLDEAGTAAGLVEGSVVALSRIATDSHLEGFALQAAPTVDVLERALGDEDLPEPAREHLEAAVRYLERVLDDPNGPYELRDEQGNLKAARRVAPDGTIYTYNAETRRYRIERPDGRVEEYEDVDPEAFERYTAPGADPDRPDPEKLFSVEIPIDLGNLTGVLRWDKLTGLVRWEYALAPLALPGILVWKAGEAVWDAATGFWAYLRDLLGREPDPPTTPPRPDPEQEVVKAEEPAVAQQPAPAGPEGPTPEDLQGWRVEYDQGFVWLRGPRGQWIRREPKDPLRNPETGAIDITGPLSGAQVRASLRGESVWLAYEGTGYVRVKGDGWTRIYEAAGPVEVWPAGDLARAEWTPGNLVFDLETDAGGYALAAHRGAGVSVRLYPGRFEVRPAEFLGAESVSDPAAAVTWYPEAGRWEGPEPREERVSGTIQAGGDWGEQFFVLDGLLRTAPVGNGEVLVAEEGGLSKGLMLIVRGEGGEYRFDAWRPDADSDRWKLYVRAYGFEERAGPVVLPADAEGPLSASRAGTEEPEPEFRTRREPDGTRVDDTPTGTVIREPSGRTRVTVTNPETGETREYVYDEQAPVFAPPPPAPEPVADGDPAQAAEADTIRRARKLRRRIREASSPEDLRALIKEGLSPLLEKAIDRPLTDRERWEIERTLRAAEAEATRRWMETAEACLDSGTLEQQWRCTQEREPAWLREVLRIVAFRQLLWWEMGGSILYGDGISRDTEARFQALLHRQDLLVRRMVERYRAQADTLTDAQRREALAPLLDYCARMQLLGWMTWEGSNMGCGMAGEEVNERMNEITEEANAFLQAGLIRYWAPLHAGMPERAEDAQRLYDALVKSKDWARDHPDHPLSLLVLVKVAQKAADNSSRPLEGGPDREEWLRLVLETAQIARERVLGPLEGATLDREGLKAPETRRRLAATIQKARRVKRTLDDLGVAGVSGGAIQRGLEDFRRRLDDQLPALVEAIRREDRDAGAWFRALSDLHAELAAAGVDGRSPAEAVREALRAQVPTTGAGPGCLTCHNGGAGSRLTRQQAR